LADLPPGINDPIHPGGQQQSKREQDEGMIDDSDQQVL
jgi:hypothetical protein